MPKSSLLLRWCYDPRKKNSVILTFKSKWWTYSKFERYKLSPYEALRSQFITTNTKGLVISENHRRRPRLYKFEFSFVGNDRQPSQKSGSVGEKICFLLSQTIGDIWFRVFVSGQNLGRSRNSKIHERLEFSRHINTRFKQAKKS